MVDGGIVALPLARDVAVVRILSYNRERCEAQKSGESGEVGLRRFKGVAMRL